MNASIDAHAIETTAGFGDFLITETSGRRFALPLGRVIGVVESGAVTPLPFSPTPFEGLVLAMGQVIPQISLAILMGLAPRDGGVAVLLSDLGGSIGLRVDTVHAMLHIDWSDVVLATAEMRAQQPLILGRFEDALAVYDILQLDDLTDHAYVHQAADDGAVLLADAVPEAAAPADETSHRVGEAYLLFRGGDDIYAIRTERLFEIVELSSRQPVPHAPAWVDGMINMRGEPTLCMSLAVLIGVTHQDIGQLGLVVASAGEQAGGARVALVTGQSLGIEHYGDEQIHALREPRGGIESYLIRSDDRIVSIVDPASLLAPIAGSLAEWLPQPGAGNRIAAPDQAVTIHQFLTMRVGREILAVPIDRIHRLQASVQTTPISNIPSGFDAVADVGDGVVPLIDLRRILAADGAAAATEGSPPCLLAVIEGGVAGIIVDQILHIENVAEHLLEPADPSAHFPITHVMRLNGQLISALSLDKLLPSL